MDIESSLGDVPIVPLPSFCLSPVDTGTSDGTQDIGLNSAYGKCSEALISLSSIDTLTFALPPTPEGSLSVESGHCEAFSEDTIVESNVPGITPVNRPLQPHKNTEVSPYPSSQNRLDDQIVNPIIKDKFENQSSLPNYQFTEVSQAVSISKNDFRPEHEISNQTEARDDKRRADESPKRPDERDEPPSADSSLSVNDLCASNSSKNIKTSNCLKFPPCVICSGKASGSHYGAITCEACKGFFRRYLQKKKEFKCTKGGKCEILSSKKGNCSGCRLKKCLALGMSKEMTKLGRYTLTKRTELIKDMKRQEENETNDSLTESDLSVLEVDFDAGTCNPETDLIMRYLLENTNTLNRSNGFNDILVVELVSTLDDFEPYGPNVKTKEQINALHKYHSDRYKRKTELFGKMNCVPRDEYNKLYKEFGIDIDGRMADMKIECEDVEGDIARYCNFAKHIPGFHALPVQDQARLLKAVMMDFYTVVMLDNYNEELQTFVSKNGHGYHFDELADREFSTELLNMNCDVCGRLQKMELSKEEVALLAALTLVSTDRCKLQNRVRVEYMQQALTELLQLQIKKEKKHTARGRFTKIIDTLTYMREMSELHMKENNMLCKDEVYTKEFPHIVDSFKIEEN